MNMRYRLLTFSVCLLTTATVDAVAAENDVLRHYGVYVYSNLCWERESGDAAGYRLTILHGELSDTALLEWSLGPLLGPAEVQDFKLDKMGRIEFRGPANSESYHSAIFHGELASERAILAADGRPQATLKRIPDTRLDIPTCSLH